MKRTTFTGLKTKQNKTKLGTSLSLFLLLRILLICIKALRGNNDFSFLILHGVKSAKVISPWQKNLGLVLEGSGCSQKVLDAPRSS